jgi:flagellar motor protein MotB
MRFVRRKGPNGVSAAWISFADLFSQLMVISLVLALVFGLRAYAAKKDATSAEEKLREIQNHTYMVKGKVVGLNLEEWREARLFQENRDFAIEQDGNFQLDKLLPGKHNLTLKIDGRRNVMVGFSVDASGFDGFQIIAGEVVDETDRTSKNDGLAINPLTDDIVAFESADHQLLPNGERFLSQEFGKSDSSGTSLLKRLKANPSLRIAVIGQADPRALHGKSYTNLGLSALRAAAVGDYLVRQLGIGSEQVMVLGLGATKEWLPAQKPGEGLDDYYSRCRRILIMYAENADQALLRKVSEIN